MTDQDLAASPWQGELAPDRAYNLLIDGEFVGSEDGRTFQCEYPATGEKWGSVPAATTGDVDRAVQAAHRAFEGGWSTTRPGERSKLLRRLADLLVEDARNLGYLQVHENGKLLSEMIATGDRMAEHAHFYAGLAETMHGESGRSNVPNTTSYSVREPIGVCAAITPWNSPLALLGWKLFPALAAGNTIVIKPSEVTPLSTLRLGELCMKAGIPAGVVNIVTGDGAVGAALVEHPLVEKIAFTGATSTGLRISQVAAARNARVTLELGGKSPNIVFDDADLDKAIDGIIAGIFSSTGQACISGSRILVQDTIGPDFFAELVRRVEAMRIGDPLDPRSQIAPLACRPHFNKVVGFFDVATAQGATAITGGGQPGDPALAGGLYVQPTLFTGVENHFRIAQEEVFGPIGAILRFRDEDEAVRIANDTEFGLAAGIWTESVRRAHRMAARIRAGSVWVNTYRPAEMARPFGGYKKSGIGREMGIHALDHYTEEKSIYLAH
ncbi:aldehyde dehydrogenase [Novosphingobium bradum]|uniref:Aldehyde dehydrogenase n=1 Tax=Novosphingobium bradum TaxID=1737444 RepID=A0ABV7IM71_9SPHN